MELLICLVDKHPAVSTMHFKAVRRGHVISVLPDGSEWGTETVKNTDWRVVKADITEIEAQALLAIPDNGEGFRSIRIDLDRFTEGEITREELMRRVI